jgi:hypothetical protein
MKISILIFLSSAISITFAQREIVCVVKGVRCTFAGQTIDKDEIVRIKVAPDGTDLNSITEVDFQASSIYYLPPQLFDVFVNLKYLNAYYQNIREIKPNTFRNARKLEELTLAANGFDHLYANMFEGAVNLKGLGVNNMQIKIVDENAFSGKLVISDTNFLLRPMSRASLHHSDRFVIKNDIKCYKF